MAAIRRNDLLASIALGCTLPFASPAFGQSIPLNRSENVKTATVTVQVAPRQHLGSGPIDLNNLPPDILNCDVCRQRLGLPPLNSTSDPVSKAQPSAVSSSNSKGSLLPQPNSAAASEPLKPIQTGRVLGSPGMITTATAEQLALNGMVVEEFKPPQPEQNAIQLGALPPEVRQDFLRGLELPPGARIMSAEIKGQTGAVGRLSSDAKNASAKMETLAAPAKTTKTDATSSLTPKTGTLGVAGIVSQTAVTPVATPEAVSSTVKPDSTTATAETIVPTPPLITPSPTPASVDFTSERNELRQTVEKLQKQLEEQASAFATKQTQIEAEVLSKKKVFDDMQQQLEENAIKLNKQMELLQLDSKKRLEQSEAASREALAMLEKRTAEVTELQLQFKAKQEAYAKAQQELAVANEALAKESEKRSASEKPDSKKKRQNKDKKPAKPTEIQ